MAIQTVKTGAAVNDGTGDDARTAFTKINQNFTDSAHAASRLVGTEWGNVMEVGAYGIGAKFIPQPKWESTAVPNVSGVAMGFYRHGFNPCLLFKADSAESWGCLLKMPHHVGEGSPQFRRASADQSGTLESNYQTFWTTVNTTVDGNGFIKKASPIVKLFADKIESNDEAKLQPITFEKLGVGDYLIKGSLGFAQEGWYIEMPKDANGNVLVAVVYEQLENNDISVKTYAKMFDPDTGDIVANTAKPRDIPSTRWIDLRLQALPQPDITPTDNTVTTNAE